MNPYTLVQARRFYHHTVNGGHLKPEDVSYMVAALEEAYDHIETTQDLIDALVAQEIGRNLREFKQDLEDKNFRHLSIDEEEGRLECEKCIEAFQLVFDYYKCE